MLVVKCDEIHEILENIKKDITKDDCLLVNVYECNGIKIDMACYIEFFGQKKVKKELCEIKIRDSFDKSEKMIFPLDEELIRPNILGGTKATHMHLGDVLYEISKNLGKEVLITKEGSPQLYIKNSFIWELNPKEINKEW